MTDEEIIEEALQNQPREFLKGLIGQGYKIVRNRDQAVVTIDDLTDDECREFARGVVYWHQERNKTLGTIQ